MTKHQLIEAVPELLFRVLGSTARTNEQKLEYLDFVEGMLDRAANNLAPDGSDSDLHMPMANLFGRIGELRRELEDDS